MLVAIGMGLELVLVDQERALASGRMCGGRSLAVVRIAAAVPRPELEERGTLVDSLEE